MNSNGAGFMELCLLRDFMHLRETSIIIAISLQFVGDEVRENENNGTQTGRIDDWCVILPLNCIGVVWSASRIRNNHKHARLKYTPNIFSVITRGDILRTFPCFR